MLFNIDIDTLLGIYLTICLQFILNIQDNRVNGLVTDIKNIFYNTTSGKYQARLVEINPIDSNDSNTLRYIHKLDVHYAEKPERFKEAFLRKYADGENFIQKPIVCFQSVHMTSYGLFNIQGAFS
jgi:hypothetical protein